MSIRVFKENNYSTDVETITPIMNIEEIEELLNSKDTLGVNSGSDWSDTQIEFYHIVSKKIDQLLELLDYET